MRTLIIVALWAYVGWTAGALAGSFVGLDELAGGLFAITALAIAVAIRLPRGAARRVRT